MCVCVLLYFCARCASYVVYVWCCSPRLQRIKLRGSEETANGCVMEVETATDAESGSYLITVFTSHWFIDCSGLQLSFGHQYVVNVGLGGALQ